MPFRNRLAVLEPYGAIKEEPMLPSKTDAAEFVQLLRVETVRLLRATSLWDRLFLLLLLLLLLLMVFSVSTPLALWALILLK